MMGRFRTKTELLSQLRPEFHFGNAVVLPFDSVSWAHDSIAEHRSNCSEVPMLSRHCSSEGDEGLMRPNALWRHRVVCKSLYLIAVY